MPKSKHRRKPGGKAIANPGRGKPGKPVTLDHLRPAPAQMDASARVVGVDDLPLFDWAEAEAATCPDCAPSAAR